MEANKMFEVSVRGKFRFPYKGSISVEDLWDLNIQQLDEIYKTLKSQEKNSQEESLLNTRNSDDEILATKIEIIKYIVNVKIDEIDKAKHAQEVHDQRQKILAILADKQDADLRNKSTEELQAMLSQLG